MTSLRCHEWDTHQSYRRDRNPPPWIKVHRSIMQNRKWARLSDAEKGQLVSIWVLAADKDGQVPNDPLLLRKLCMLDDEPNLQKFIDLGLLVPFCRQDDVNVTPNGRQIDSPDIEVDIEVEEKIEDSNTPPCPHSEIIDLYHEVLHERPAIVKSRWHGGESAKRLRRRWCENPEHQDLDWWRGFFSAVLSNDWWMGRNEKWPKGVSLHWLVKRANFDKVIEHWANEVSS